MKVCVFVDGENFRYTLRHLFGSQMKKNDYLPRSAKWVEFFDYLVEQATGGKGTRLRTYWYVVRHVDIYPGYIPSQHNDPVKLEELSRQHGLLQQKYNFGPKTKFDKHLLEECYNFMRTGQNNIKSRFEGFRRFQEGIAFKHRSIEFRRSGGIGYELLTGKFRKEKTVDVNLAVDMVGKTKFYDMAIIVSGDQDYVPAVQAVKDAGRSTVNVAFKARSNRLLPGGAKRLNHTTDWSFDVPFDECCKYMGFEKLDAAAVSSDFLHGDADPS